MSQATMLQLQEIGSEAKKRFKPVTEENVRKQTDSASFKNGESYFRGDYILNPVLRGKTLRARSLGQSGEPYTVQVDLVPVGDKGSAIVQDCMAMPLLPSWTGAASRRRWRSTAAQVGQARTLAVGEEDVETSIAEMGQGWVGEEALAIAIYCALKFPDDWRKGVLAAANHSWDSDSTASICGAILGARLGLSAVPAEWVHSVENAAGIMKIADDMYLGFQKMEEPTWQEYPGF